MPVLLAKLWTYIIVILESAPVFEYAKKKKKEKKKIKNEGMEKTCRKTLYSNISDELSIFQLQTGSNETSP